MFVLFFFFPYRFQSSGKGTHAINIYEIASLTVLIKGKLLTGAAVN